MLIPNMLKQGTRQEQVFKKSSGNSRFIDRDANIAINIKMEGLRIYHE